MNSRVLSLTRGPRQRQGLTGKNGESLIPHYAAALMTVLLQHFFNRFVLHERQPIDVQGYLFTRNSPTIESDDKTVTQQDVWPCRQEITPLESNPIATKIDPA